VVKASHVIAKRIVERASLYLNLEPASDILTSYTVKTSLLHHVFSLQLSRNDDDSLCSVTDVVFKRDQKEEIKFWVERIFHGLLYFTLICHTPDCFLSSFSRCSCKDDPHLKFLQQELYLSQEPTFKQL